MPQLRSLLSKTYSILVLSLMLSMVFTAANAADQGQADRFFPVFSGKIGYQLSHMDYSEDGMNEKGYLNGIYAGLTFHPGRTMIKLEGDYSSGDIDYDGQTWGGTPLTSSGDNKIFNLRGLLGYDWISGNQAITPYLGIAVRYWKDDQDSSSGYKRETWYYYSPIGVMYNYKSASAWSFALQAEYDIFWQGKNKSAFSDVNPGLNDIEVKQTQGYGVFLSASITYDFGIIGLNVEPFFQYWDVKESDSAALYYYGQLMTYAAEPDNDTKVWGVRVSADF